MRLSEPRTSQSFVGLSFYEYKWQKISTKPYKFLCDTKDLYSIQSLPYMIIGSSVSWKACNKSFPNGHVWLLSATKNAGMPLISLKLLIIAKQMNREVKTGCWHNHALVHDRTSPLLLLLLNCYVLCTVLLSVLCKCVFICYGFFASHVCFCAKLWIYPAEKCSCMIWKILEILFMHDFVKIIKEVVHTQFTVVNAWFAEIKIFITWMILQDIVKAMTRSCLNHCAGLDSICFISRQAS